MIITIDGPTASGKSTVGRLLAKQRSAYYLYTGLLYRGLAYILMRDYGYTLDTIDQPDMQIVDMILSSKRFSYRYDPNDRERIFYDGIDLTPNLKGDTIGQGASIVSTHPQVRERLNVLQRAIADHHDVVIDGRDSGSVVFPHADKKFFLTASDDVRAARWMKDQSQKGNPVSIQEAKSFITKRDNRDSQRKIAPLTIPQGARVIDNSGLSIDETLSAILSELS